MPYLEVKCPACETNLAHEIIIRSAAGNPIDAQVQVVKSQTLDELILTTVNEIVKEQLSRKEAADILKRDGFSTITHKIMEVLEDEDAFSEGIS
jgi:hypothetical protein